MSATSSSECRERHSSLYLDDGNIVLAARAEPSGGTTSADARTVLFRVHISTLKRQSLVFADMFSLPVGPSGANSDTEDGVTLVNMPDSAEDIESMLEVLYDPTYVTLQVLSVSILTCLLVARPT